MGARLLFAALAGFALILVAGAVFVSQPGGQRFITDRILRAIGGADQTFTVKEIGGDWPSHIIWSGITASDAKGIWLEIDRFEAELHPAALLVGRLEIVKAAIGTLHMLRQPAASPSAKPSPPPTLADISRAISRITVRDARIDALLVDEQVMGHALDAVLSGSLQDDPNSRLHTLALDGRLKQQPGALALKVAAGRNAALIQVKAEADRLSAAGALTVNNSSNALSGAAKFDCRSEPVCFAWPSGHIGTATADLRLAGTVASPQGTLDFQVRDFLLDARSFTELDGQISARPKQDAPRGVVAITGSGAAAGIARAMPELGPLLADRARWSFALTRTPDAAVVLDTARIEAGDATLDAAAMVLTPNFTPSTLRLSLSGGARLFGLQDTSSRTVASLRVDRWEDSGSAAGHLTVATTGLPATAAVPPLVQGTLDLEADVMLTSDRVAFSNILARSGSAVRGRTTWLRSPRFEHDRSSLTVTLPPWAVLPEETQADVDLTGPLAALHAEVSATAPAILLSRVPVFDAVMSGTVDRTPAGFTASLDGNGRWIDGAVAISAKAMQVSPGMIDVPTLRWVSTSVALSGNLRFETRSGLLSGEISGPVRDLAPLTTAFGAASAGNGNFSARFSGRTEQRLDVGLAARSVANAALEAGELNFTGTFTDLWGEMKISTRADAREARLFGRPLAAFTTGTDGDLKTLRVELNAKGAADTPFALTSVSNITFGASTAIEFHRFALEDGEIKAVLQAPARLSIGAAAVSLAPLRLKVLGGEAEASFTWDRANDNFDGSLRADKVAIPSFVGLPGQTSPVVVSGAAHATGPITSVNGGAQITGILPATKDQPAITFSSSIALANGRAKIEATATGLSAEPARLSADIPARLNLAAARLSASPSERMSASLKWIGNLAPLWRFVPADVNVLAGEVVIDAAVSGTFDTPVLTGTISLAHGTYENLVGGTALRNIEAGIGGDGEGGFTLSLKAQDMNDGNLALSGRIAGDAQMTANVTADLSRLDVVHRDDVVAAATGKITYEGPLGAGVFKGQVQLVRSLVRLGGSYMPEIPLLRALPGFEPAGNRGLLAQMRLDIAVTTADPMRIEGEGLDSVWRGELHVTGSLAQPDVRGTLTLDRGAFSFIGQGFTLGSGTVTFTGGGTIDPQLYVVATREASDVTATVTITGRARSPELQLSSTPSLPRDEILARLLFRKGTGQLGPIESIQLASAASDLAGLSQGGINGVLRRTFGIDVSSGAEGNSVMVGRQFGRNLYVSVGQSLTEQEREIVVEWRFSRSLSVKSTTSDVTGADIGVFWRKDY